MVGGKLPGTTASSKGLKKQLSRGDVQRLKRGVENARALRVLLASAVKTGAKRRILEVVSGEHRLTALAIRDEDWDPLEPIDIRNGYDLRKASVRRDLLKQIEEEKPDVVTLAPLCSPWSSRQRLQDPEIVNAKREADMFLAVRCSRMGRSD